MAMQVNDFKISVNINDTFGDSINFTSLSDLIKKCKIEGKYWDGEIEKLKKSGVAICGHISAGRKMSVLASQLASLDVGSIKDVNMDVNFFVENNAITDFIWKSNKATKAILEINEKMGAKEAQAFIDLLKGGSGGVVNSKKLFEVYLYSVIHDGNFDFGRIVKSFRSSAIEAINDLHLVVEDGRIEAKSLLNDLDEWKESSRNSWNDFLYKVNEDKNIVFESVKNEYNLLKNEVDMNFDVEKSNLSLFVSNSTKEIENYKKKIGELEDLYRQQLKLKKPVEYWSARASRLKKQGLVALLASSVVAVSSGFLFYFIFSDWLAGVPQKVSTSTIQGGIIFACLAATIAYLLKIFSKLIFSSFHLMRDAEEREQLTYLYLALINESAVSKDESAIVLQSLFSRSESGLLTNDSSPTLPTISEVIKKPS